MHTLHATDGTGSTIRTALLDFRKAFDFVDHQSWESWRETYSCELGDIFSKEQTAEGETKWSGIWLVGCSCWSAPGDPFGSMAISGDYNDLRLPEGFHMWKFAADTTVSEVVPASKHSSLRQAADYVHDLSQENHLQLNPTKCKETRTWFKRTPSRYCSQWFC